MQPHQHLRRAPRVQRRQRAGQLGVEHGDRDVPGPRDGRGAPAGGGDERPGPPVGAPPDGRRPLPAPADRQDGPGDQPGQRGGVEIALDEDPRQRPPVVAGVAVGVLHPARRVVPRLPDGRPDVPVRVAVGVGERADRQPELVTQPLPRVRDLPGRLAARQDVQLAVRVAVGPDLDTRAGDLTELAPVEHPTGPVGRGALVAQQARAGVERRREAGVVQHGQRLEQEVFVPVVEGEDDRPLRQLALPPVAGEQPGHGEPGEAGVPQRGEVRAQPGRRHRPATDRFRRVVADGVVGQDRHQPAAVGGGENRRPHPVDGVRVSVVDRQLCHGSRFTHDRPIVSGRARRRSAGRAHGGRVGHHGTGPTNPPRGLPSPSADPHPAGETDSMPETANSRCAPRRWHHELTHRS